MHNITAKAALEFGSEAWVLKKTEEQGLEAAQMKFGDSGSTVVKVLCYNSEGRWFDPGWCQWIFR